MIHYPEFQKEKINFVFGLGGLGDNISRLPVIRYIADRHPHVIPMVWVPDYFYPIAKNALPDIRFDKFSTNGKFNESLPGRTTANPTFTNLKTHMTLHAFCCLANEVPSIEHHNYLKLDFKAIGINRFYLPEKYVVMTCCYTAPIREFLPEYINTISDYVISKGYSVVFLGQKLTDAGIKGHEIIGNLKQDIDFSKGINLIDQTSLLEASKIMSQAKAVVGLDNGLLHLAAMSDVSIVAGFTSVDPDHRAPVRNNIKGYNYYPVVPPLDVKERFCQSIWDFQFTHDFKYSYYKTDELIKSVTPELYIQQLEKIL